MYLWLFLGHGWCHNFDPSVGCLALFNYLATTCTHHPNSGLTNACPWSQRLLGLCMSMNQWKDCSHFWICNSKHLTYWSWVNSATLVLERQYIITIIAFEEVKRNFFEKDYLFLPTPNENNYVRWGTLLPHTCPMIFKCIKCIQVTPFSLQCLKKLKLVLFSLSFPWQWCHRT